MDKDPHHAQVVVQNLQETMDRHDGNGLIWTSLCTDGNYNFSGGITITQNNNLIS